MGSRPPPRRPGTGAPGPAWPRPRGPCRSRPPPAAHSCLPSALPSTAAGAIFPRDKHPAPAVTSAATCGPGERGGTDGRARGGKPPPPRGGPARPRSPAPAPRRAACPVPPAPPCPSQCQPGAGSRGETGHAPASGAPYRSRAEAASGWGWGKRRPQASSAAGP